MSGILKRIIQYKKYLLLGGILIVIELLIVYFFRNRNFWKVILFIDLFGIILLLIDVKSIQSIHAQMNPFDAYCWTRNVDYLIIGEPCEPLSVLPDKNYTYVQIKAPGASEFALYQILRRTFSILKEQGTVIFAINKNNINKKRIRVFDIFFLHDVTIQEMKLNRLSRLKKFVLIANPYSCIQLLSGTSYHDIKELKNYNSKIVDKFCVERKIFFQVFTK